MRSQPSIRAPPLALVPADVPAAEQDPAASPDGPRLPEVIRPEPVISTLVLATATPESLPGIATARAAGVDVQIVALSRSTRGPRAR